MKLKFHNVSNSKSFVAGKATLRINERAGLLTLSKLAARIIGISDAEATVEFCQNEEFPEDFYILKSDSPEAFTLRIKNGSPSFNCSKLATLLLDRGEEKKHSIPLKRAETFIIGSSQEIDGITAHLIIFSKPFKA
jgi:hypothetical protein